MQYFMRWLAAIGATIGAFAIGLYVSGALLLPLWIKSTSDRWVVAAGLGVALAALAALWGIQFAQIKSKEMETYNSAAPPITQMKAKASEKGTVYQAGRDQTINRQ